MLSSYALLLLFSSYGQIDAHAHADLRCGPNCLYIALRALTLKDVKLKHILDALGPPQDGGYSMSALERVAQRHGAHTLMLRSSLDALRSITEPFVCITLVNNNHWVLIADADSESLTLVDPPRSTVVRRVVFDTLSQGDFLLLGRAPFPPVPPIVAVPRTSAMRYFMLILLLCSTGIAFVWAVRHRLKRSTGPMRILVCLSLCGLGPLGCGDADAERPQSLDTLTLTPNPYHLGTLVLDDERSDHKAIHADIINHGRTPIRVTQLNVSCSCTEPYLTSTHIEPGATSRLDALISLGIVPEERSAWIDIVTDNPTQKSKWMILWKTIHALSADPATLRFSLSRECDDDSTQVSDLYLYCKLGHEAALHHLNISVTPSASWISAAVESKTPQVVLPKTSVTDYVCYRIGILKVTIIPSGLPEVYDGIGVDDQTAHGSVRVRVERNTNVGLHLQDGSVAYEVTLPVIWKVSNDIEIAPRILSFGATKPDHVGTCIVTVSNHSDDAITLSNIGIADGELQHVTLSVQAHDHLAVPIQVRAPSARGPWRKRIDINVEGRPRPLVAYVSGLCQ